MLCHPTPARMRACAPTLPLQGRVNSEVGAGWRRSRLPSCEQPVHIPDGLHRQALLRLELAVIQTIAIEPEAQAVLVLDAEIVARQPLPLRPPPFHRDALRAFGAHDRMGRSEEHTSELQSPDH